MITTPSGDDDAIHDRLIKLLTDADRATSKDNGSAPRCCQCRRAAVGTGQDGRLYCRSCMPKPAA